jgi:hypothetical protein
MLNFALVDGLKQAVMDAKPTQPYVCLHARIESDFEAFFRSSPRYKNAAQIAKMMADHHWDRSLRCLYLAGGSTGGIKELLERRAHGAHPFDKIVSLKDLPRHERFNRLEKAMIDLGVCEEADVHVGSAGSIWSEWVHGSRRVRNLPSLMYAGDRWVTRLERFDGVNDNRFFRTYDGPIEIVDTAVGNHGVWFRDTRIQQAVERARRGSELVIPPDFGHFFGYDPMPGATKKLLVTVRVGNGTEQRKEFLERVGGTWRP